MERNEPGKALMAYKHSIELYPRRFNSLLGAAKTADAMGNKIVARAYYEQLLKVAEGAMRPAVNEARQYLARQ